MFKYIKEEVRSLKGSWGYLLLVLIPILRKTVFNRARDMNDYNVVDGNASVAIVMVFITVFLLLTKQKELKLYWKSNKTFINYYLFALASVIWAGLDSIPIAGFKAVEVLSSYLLMLLIMVRIGDAFQNFRFILFSLSFLNTIYLIRLAGHNNAYPLLGITELLLVLGALRYRILRFRQVWHHLLIAIPTIILSTSSASWLSLIIGLFFLYSQGRRGWKLWHSILVAGVFYLLWMTFEETIFHIVWGNKSKEMIESGTGREQLWKAYIEGWKESPIIGHGFIVGEKGAVAAHYIAFATNTAHNMMISVLVNTGLIGMALWLMFLWKQCRICWVESTKKNPYALACFPAFVAMCVNANSFPVIGSEWSPVSPPIYALIIFIFLYVPQYRTKGIGNGIQNSW